MAALDARGQTGVVLEGRHQDTEDGAQMGHNELYLLLKWLQQSDTSRLSHSLRRHRNAQRSPLCLWLLGPFKSCGLATSGLPSLTHN